jgi:apolipoprotein N-acyltransferase
MAFFSTTLSWVTISMHLYGKLPWVPSYALMFLLCGYLSIYFGLFSLGFRWILDRFGLPGLLFAPLFWTALEMVRGRILTGFPWALLGYSQHRFLQIIQISDITGVYGVGALIILSNAAVWALLSRRRAGAVVAIVATVCFLSAWTYGVVRLSQEMVDPNKMTAVSLIQGNIEQDRKWDEKFRGETLGIYERLSLETLGGSGGPRLLVWPESAVPFLFEREPRYRQQIARFAKRESDYLLFGSPSVLFASDGSPTLYNSAYLLSPEGAILGRYDKIHLVPFGEYVPLSKPLFFVNKMVEGIGDFQSGNDFTLMSVGGIPFGTVICFEVIFPELVREFVARGAEFMATLTNDAWFGDSAAPYQHFSMVVFRSVENRVPFVRSANTGISGFIDPHGRILQKSPLFQEAVLSREIHPGKYRTFYSRHGDLFGWGCAIMACALIAAGRHTRGRK